MNAIRPVRMEAQPAASLKAWRVGQHGNEAITLDIGKPATLDAALASAIDGNSLQHKDHLLIADTHAGRNRGTLHVYAIKRKSAPVYRRDPATGLSKAVHQLYASHLFALPVDAFDPTRAFDAFRDPAHGRDPQLVESA